MLQSWFRDSPGPAAALFAMSLLPGTHLRRRLRRIVARFRRAIRALRSRASRDPSSQVLHVKECPICGGPGAFEYENGLSLLSRCRECDHVYARDLPSDKALTALYGDLGYWEKDRCHQGITTIQEGKGWEGYLNARIGILQRLGLLDHRSNRATSVFEIGCAEGMLLHELGKRGIEASGCEMNVVVAKEGIRQLGASILTVPFEKIELPPRHFDLVMSFHTLEHMRFPIEVFRKAADILREEGAMLVEVPCGEEEYDNTDHLHFFCDKSLRLLLDRFFISTEIVNNFYTNSAGVRIGSIAGFGRGVRSEEAVHVAARSRP